MLDVITSRMMAGAADAVVALNNNPDLMRKMEAYMALSRAYNRVILASGLKDIGNNFLNIIGYVAHIGGAGLFAFGVFSFATAFTAHDATQKRNGIFEMLGGALIFVTPWLINTILGEDIVDESYTPS